MAKSSFSKKARVLSSRESYRGPAFRVTTDEVVEPSGIRVRRDVVRHSGSVVVLAVDKDSRVLLERQYRHSAGKFLHELPAGGIEEGESSLAAGKRELLEETGFSARKWKRILTFWPSPGFLAETRKMNLGVESPRTGEQLQKMIEDAYRTPPEIVRRLRQLSLH